MEERAAIRPAALAAIKGRIFFSGIGFNKVIYSPSFLISRLKKYYSQATTVW